jgi:hypothetical protein
MLRGTLVVVGLLVAAAPSPAIARASGLLNTEPGTTFVVRPPFMTFDETQFRGGTTNYFVGPGLTVKTWHTHPNSRIHWIRWGAKAVGRGTLFDQVCSSLRGVIQYCTPKYIGAQVAVTAWRRRGGRYTRLVFRFGPPLYPSTYTYGLRRVTIKVKGLPNGVSAFSWCAVNFRARCSHP